MVDEQILKTTRATIDGIEVNGHPSLISALKSGDSSGVEVKAPFRSRIAFGISFSRPTRGDLENQGYDVLLEIGSPDEYNTDVFPSLAVKAAAIITKAAKVVKSKKIFLALSCPTTVAFMIGQFLGTRSRFITLHYQEGSYKTMPECKPERVLKKTESL